MSALGGVCSGGCLLWGGVCSGGCLLPGEVSALGGIYSWGRSVLGGCLACGGVCLGGVSALGGVCSWGCLIGGVVCSWGCLIWGFVCSQGVSQHALRQTPHQEAELGIRSMSGQYAFYWNAFLYHMLRAGCLKKKYRQQESILAGYVLPTLLVRGWCLSNHSRMPTLWMQTLYPWSQKPRGRSTLMQDPSIPLRQTPFPTGNPPRRQDPPQRHKTPLGTYPFPSPTAMNRMTDTCKNITLYQTAEGYRLVRASSHLGFSNPNRQLTKLGKMRKLL